MDKWGDIFIRIQKGEFNPKKYCYCCYKEKEPELQGSGVRCKRCHKLSPQTAAEIEQLREARK